MSYQNNRDDVLPYYEDETAAIQRRDPEAARAACGGRAYLMAQTMLAELFRRRVFAAPDDVRQVVSNPLPVLARSEAVRGEPSMAL